jgi:hypothetical protein
MNTADLELIRRMIQDLREDIDRRLEPLEALLGFSEPWQNAASALEGYEHRIAALEAAPVAAVAAVVETPAEAAAEAIEDAAERIEEATEAAEVAAEVAVEAAAEAETAAEEAAAIVEAPASATDTPGVGEEATPGESETPGVINEILGEEPEQESTPQRGGFWHSPILTPRRG